MRCVVYDSPATKTSSPTVCDPKRLGKVARARILKQDRDRKRVNRAWAFRRDCRVIGNFLCELGCRRASESEELDPRCRIRS